MKKIMFMFLFVFATATISNAKNKISVKSNISVKSMVKSLVISKSETSENNNKVDDSDALMQCCRQASSSATTSDGYTITVTSTACAPSCEVANIIAHAQSDAKLEGILEKLD